jgi:hypothetical protein
MEAAVRDARLHDARHTAATVLLLLGVPLPAVMEIMGWSNSKVAKRYSHVTAAIQNSIASQVNTLLGEPNKGRRFGVLRRRPRHSLPAVPAAPSATAVGRNALLSEYASYSKPLRCAEADFGGQVVHGPDQRT